MFKHLNLSVYLYLIAYALIHSGGSLIIFIAGIIGQQLAPSPDQATLPVALMIVGVAASALPLGKLQVHFGRKPVFIGFALLAVLAALFAAYSLVLQTFMGFCFATFLLGFTIASAHQYRFAVIEEVGHAYAAQATSLLLLGGFVSAFLGPELAVLGRDWLATEFSGSFLLLGLVFLLSFALLFFINKQTVSHSQHAQVNQQSGLALIAQTPLRVLALFTAVVGYGVMSFIMTATPLTMHEHIGHSLQDTKLVIQSHIAAMFLPSLFSGYLISRLGYQKIIWSGVAIFISCIAIALLDTDFLHFWLALVLLGIGWNFLFVSATALLSMGYQTEDRFKVQSANDFVLFSFQALAALSSGWVLSLWQWQGLLLGSLLLLVVYAAYFYLNQQQLRL